MRNIGDIKMEEWMRYSPTYESSKLIPRHPLSYYGKFVGKLGSGTYANVYRYDGGYYGLPVAIKFPHTRDATYQDPIPYDILMEVAVMKRLQHPNIVEIIDFVTDLSGSDLTVGVVQPLAQSDLYTFITTNKATPVFTKDKIAYQIVCGVAYMHSRHVIHRDIKPQNILYYGPDDVRISDLGAAQPYACLPDIAWNPVVFTRWYRAPEVLLSPTARYTLPADAWALGATLWELYTGKPLFPGNDEQQVMNKIISVLGTPTVDEWPDFRTYPAYGTIKTIRPPNRTAITNPLPTTEIAQLINEMLVYDPDKRPTASNVLRSDYFDDVRNAANESGITDCAVSHETRDRYAAESSIEPLVRMGAINLIARACDTQNRHVKTYLIAVSLFDQVSVAIKPARNELLSIAIACLSVADSLSERKALSIAKILKDTSSTITVVDVNSALTRILDVCNYDLIFTVPYDYHDEVRTDQATWDVIKGLFMLSSATRLRLEISPHEMFNVCVGLGMKYSGLAIQGEYSEAVSAHAESFITDIAGAWSDIKAYFDHLTNHTTSYAKLYSVLGKSNK